MPDQILDKTYRLEANVQLGKFTVVVVDNSPYADGCAVPGASNASGVLGVAQSSIIPNSVADYSGGVYGITSGSSWPANSVPSSGAGRHVKVRCAGITHVVLGGTVTRGDRLNVADSQGRVKTINEVAGTLVHEVGEALEGGVSGEVIRMRLTLNVRHS